MTKKTVGNLPFVAFDSFFGVFFCMHMREKVG